MIPREQLPEGFAENLGEPDGKPSVPRAAATVVLMRPTESGGRGLEVLLVRRVRSSGFVPGAYVFPGGRVDATDGAEEILHHVSGLSADEATRRLGLTPRATPPALAYYVSALRETFEETGILLAREPDGTPVPSAAGDASLARDRDGLLRATRSLQTILRDRSARLDLEIVEYVAHWITPRSEPRRYDTRFFAAAVEGDRIESLNPAEMSDGVWLSPAEALARHSEGDLPMIFPTIRTLEALAGFRSPRAVLDHYAERAIPTVRPRLLRGDDGVSIEEE